MALNSYLTLKGAKTGPIKGSVVQKGREGSIMVIATNHEIVSPRDAASGQASGKRMHKPLVITKELDKATPLLYNALCTNESIVEFVLRYWRAAPAGGTGTGTEVQHFTVKLTNAQIASIRQVMPNSKEADLARLETYEEVAFVYQKIEWTWNDGGITASADWQAPIT